MIWVIDWPWFRNFILMLIILNCISSVGPNPLPIRLFLLVLRVHADGDVREKVREKRSCTY